MNIVDSLSMLWEGLFKFTGGASVLIGYVISVILIISIIYLIIIKPIYKIIVVKNKKEKWYWLSLLLMIAFGFFGGVLLIVNFTKWFGFVGMVIGIIFYILVISLLYRSSNIKKV